VADCFEHGDEPSGSIKGEEYVDYWLLCSMELYQLR
jgi:hypothetical protein